MGEEAGEILARIARAHHLVGDAVEIAEGVGARVLEHELEAAKAAHAVHGRRLKGLHDAAVGSKHQHAKVLVEAGDNVGG